MLLRIATGAYTMGQTVKNSMNFGQSNDSILRPYLVTNTQELISFNQNARSRMYTFYLA